MIQTLLPELPTRQSLQTRLVFALSLMTFVLCTHVGCHAPDMLRRHADGSLPQERNDHGSGLERLTYARHQPHFPQERTQALNETETVNRTTNRIVNRTLVARADDPPEIAELIGMLHETNRFSDEEKEEIVELLRRESPAMRASMIANYRTAIRQAEYANRPATGDANPITQVSYQSADRGIMNGAMMNGPMSTNEMPVRRANHVGYADASDTVVGNGSDSQGEILLASGYETNNRSVRINRLQSELGSPPRIAGNEDNEIDDEFEYEPFSPTPRHHVPDDLPANVARSLADSDRNAHEIAPFRQSGDLATKESGTRIGFADPASANRQNAPVTLNDRTASNAAPANPSYAANGRQTSRSYDHDMRAEYEPAYAEYYDDALPADMYERDPMRHVRIASAQRRPERWDEALRQSLDSLNTQIDAPGMLDHEEQLQAEINQRLMYLVLGNQRDAIRPIDGLSPELQEFWRNELLGLSTMLDDVSIPDTSHRFAVAQHHLQAANLHLQSLCPIRIKNIHFINQCDGFGVYETAKSEFRRGEPIFVYAEIDNLVCREHDDGYHTQVSSSYEIVDVLGNKISNGEFSKTGKYTQSRIRDAFLLWRVDLPENAMPGKYFLRISVSDLNHPNHQFDQQSLELDILPSLHNR